jgi:RNA polymerase sigma-54 factor
MAELSQNLQLRQQQRLVMTPQLKQALKILQLNTMELSDLINVELAENPMLEEVGDGADEPGPVDVEGVETSADSSTEAPAESVEAAEIGDGGAEGSLDLGGFEAPENPAEVTKEVAPDQADGHELDDWAKYFDDDGTDYSFERGERESGGDDKDTFETFLVRPETLQEHLLAQLESEDFTDSQRALIEEVIGRVDERGYFEGSLEALAADQGVTEREAFTALRRVQKLDPSGVAARDLRECLLLQLESGGHKGSQAWNAIEQHFDLVAKRRWDLIAKELGLDARRVAEAEHLVAALEPLPGRPYGGQPNAGVPVDAIVEQDLGGRWRVLINDSGMPRLGLSSYYRRMMKQGAATDAEAKAWLKEKQQAALWLMRGIDQRHRTLRRVLEEIVDVQQGFFEHGTAAFVPLTLKEIAERTGLHESTISRVTTGKYVQTPRGVFELKFFFSSSLKTEEGGETSSRAVKDKLRQLMDEESPADPLSDQALAERLSADGIMIARRTVAKYREELRLPPAHLRRKR